MPHLILLRHPQIHVLARVRVGPASVYIPLKVEDIQMSANARITVRPLVDTLPCLGAVAISLVESPFVDLTVKAITDLDLLSLPGIHEAMTMGVKMACQQARIPFMT
jgi:Ca2+-dependent lipid-binding protein